MPLQVQVDQQGEWCVSLALTSTLSPLSYNIRDFEFLFVTFDHLFYSKFLCKCKSTYVMLKENLMINQVTIK
jgi:hypothetical protein